MNNLRISEIEKESLRKAKVDVVRLRTLGEQENDPRVKKEILAELCAARFYHDVIEEGLMEEIRCKKQIQRNDIIAKRVKWFVIAIAASILFLIIFCSSCQTMKGAMGDTAWLLKTGSDNIKVQEK